jgi:hypothetical protein
MIRPSVEIPRTVHAEMAKDHSIIEEGYEGIFVHFQGVTWERAFDNVQIVEDFLSRLNRRDFLFIRVSSLEDIETAGGWNDHPFKRFLPYNLVEHLDSF